MKVIVTGGAGFIGSHLAESLLNEKRIKKIILIDNFKDGNKKNIKTFQYNKKIKIIKKDILKLKKNDPIFKNINCVIHLAAIADIVPSIDNPYEYCLNNFIGTIKILDGMRYNKINKIIYAASSSCYGIPKKYPTNESEKIDLRYPYAFSKYIAEEAIIHWSKIYKLNFISLRLFNVYGTRARTTGAYGAVMGVFLKQKLENKPLTVIGNGHQKRDFIHVKDVCKVFIKSLFTKKNNQIFNIGSSKPQKIINLAKKINKKITYIPERPGEPKITFANISKVKAQLKWKPKILFTDGINDLLKNINYWKNAPLWNKKNINKATKSWFKYLS